jgi:HAD superfamily hydrolase (TIGR01549 family)
MKFFETINIENIKLIIFDLDDTLYDYKKCNNIAFQIIFKKFNKYDNINDIFEKARQNIKNIHKNTALEHDKSLQIKEMFRLLNIKDTNLLKEIIDLYYTTFLENVELSTDWLYFFEKCKNKNIIMVILTNNTLVNQLDIYNKLKLYKYFDNIFTSYEIGYEKPNIKCFEYINNIYNIDKNNILMIGDSYDSDGIGAINYQIKYKLYNSLTKNE